MHNFYVNEISQTRTLQHQTVKGLLAKSYFNGGHFETVLKEFQLFSSFETIELRKVIRADRLTDLGQVSFNHLYVFLNT